MQNPKKPLALIILDGWGYREDLDNNAIANANTPVLDKLQQSCANTLISGSGIDVGLPDGQMGNSEVGHVNLGAGRVVYQDFTRITKSIKDGDFYDNSILVENMDKAIDQGKAIHIMGLMSAGGVHSHQDHIFAAIKMAAQRGAKAIYLHCFLDGRDTPPRSAKASLEAAQALFAELGVGQVASLIGRYYAMDRDKRWDRVEKAFNLMSKGEAEQTAASAVEGLELTYAQDKNDEFTPPTWIEGASPMQDGDTLIFMNFRADRAREISQVFVDPTFDGFDCSSRPQLAGFVSLTQYEEKLATETAYPPVPLKNVMGEWLALHDKTQLRISETEKYAHVTFFYSGGKEDEFPGETRVLIPSPDVATYDLQPEMNSTLLTDKLVEAIKSGEHDVIICNYPNGDMVGHTGVYDAAVKACEAVDACIGRVVSALQEVGGECLITADHGNAEQMVDHNTGQAHTAHTSELVPFIYVGRDAQTRADGTLSDVAPTMLHLMGMPQPEDMTGSPIVKVS